MTEETTEIWKDIPCYEGIYKVSNTGKVKSLERKVKGKNGSIRTRKEKILKPKKRSDGYLEVNLWIEGKYKTMKIHRLVCEAFLPNPYNLPEVNHINEDKEDNILENLEYCDRKYNCNFGTAIERRTKKQKGVYNTKKSKPVKCLETGVTYPSVKEVQRQFGFHNGYIGYCCNGKFKQAYGYHWEWA